MGSLASPSSPLARKHCPQFRLSGLSATLIELLVTYEYRPCHGQNDADFDVSAPLPCPVRLVCAPSLDPPQLRRRQSFVIRKKSRTAIIPSAAIPPHFQVAENAFPEGKEDSLIHDGQAAHRPQYGYIIPMLLLTRALVTVFPRFSGSTKPVPRSR